MKFGKQFALQRVVEWSHVYLDYKTLKRIIKRDVALEEANPLRAQSSSSTSTQSKSDEAFVRTVRVGIRKFDNFAKKHIDHTSKLVVSLRNVVGPDADIAPPVVRVESEVSLSAAVAAAEKEMGKEKAKEKKRTGAGPPGEDRKNPGAKKKADGETTPASAKLTADGTSSSEGSSVAVSAVPSFALSPGQGDEHVVEPMSLKAVSLVPEPVAAAKMTDSRTTDRRGSVSDACAPGISIRPETLTAAEAAAALKKSTNSTSAAVRADFQRDKLEYLLQKLSMVENFIVQNCTAVEKIGKKRDKQFPNHPPVLPSLKADMEKRREARFTVISSLRDTILELMPYFPSMPMEKAEGELMEMDAMVTSKRDIHVVSELNIAAIPVGVITQLQVCLSRDALGNAMSVPVLVAKGEFHGPTVGITAALHGNELNGIPIIHRVFQELDLETMRGVGPVGPSTST